MRPRARLQAAELLERTVEGLKELDLDNRALKFAILHPVRKTSGAHYRGAHKSWRLQNVQGRRNRPRYYELGGRVPRGWRAHRHPQCGGRTNDALDRRICQV